ncbi:hypothetical protein LOAG_14605 [Loa loa]|uniref:Uncharacterized protein n=1 Tax=Loa loa TaxID=7209 RepID=A0A1S0THC7_LOALO|nr:hypothetical protein LOAG_14605 [Loa loa]EFO13921.2 hypothetical protein LOAG_14605 [Loa loa]
MSESQTSSASASTILTISSDLPLDDPLSLEKTVKDLPKISNSFQNAELNSVNCENFQTKNDETIIAAPVSILKNANPDKVELELSVDAQKSLRNDNQDEVHHVISQETNIKTNDKVEIKGKQKVVIREMFENDPSIDTMKGDIGDNEVKKSVNIPIIRNVEFKIENDEVCGKNLESMVTNSTNITDERNNAEVKTSEMMKCSEDIVLEANGNRVDAKSPNRTMSESPPGATDSWKNATINMNHLLDDGTRSGDIQSAYNTTFRNHQTKIIYNNKTLIFDFDVFVR